MYVHNIYHYVSAEGNTNTGISELKTEISNAEAITPSGIPNSEGSLIQVSQTHSTDPRNADEPKTSQDPVATTGTSMRTGPGATGQENQTL